MTEIEIKTKLCSAPQSVYVHFPFCKTKCPYCDFASEAIPKSEHKDRSKRYLERLLEEIDWRMQRASKQTLKTIYFGGGTPSLEDPEHIAKVIAKLAEYQNIASDAEITLEANPGTIDHSRLEDFKAAGINRISIGAQTFDENLLVKLGRGHSLADTDRALQDIIAIGFRSWSLDLMYGLAGQTMESWRETIKAALSYKPPHISAYALSIEEGTPYGEIYALHNAMNKQERFIGNFATSLKHPDLPSDDVVAGMYELLHQELEAASLLRYEISNWAQRGHESQHNLTYWRAEKYWAFGLGAHGYVIESETQSLAISGQGYRYANPKQLEAYYDLDFAKQERVFIDHEESMIERIMLGLRLEEGLNLNEELLKYIDLEKLEYFVGLGLIGDSESSLHYNVKLSTKGILLSNRIIAELITT